MKTISLTKGYKTIVDDEDYDYLMQWDWHALISKPRIYAERCARKKGQKVEHIMMHRVINNTPKGFFTDHINGNTLDNRRINLRTVTHAQNMWNRMPNTNASSKYKGVAWHKQHNKWCVTIQVNKKRIFIGLFEDELEAAISYVKRAKIEFGKYAKELKYE